jgi:chromosome segregation ATPase
MKLTKLKLENDHLELKIKSLESKVLELKQIMSQPPKHNLAIDESKWVPRTTVDELIRKVQHEEAKLKNRIVDLEAEIRGLKPDNSYMLNTLNSKLLEKELLCASFETKCNQLEKKMLELVNNSDVSSIKEAMKNALLENENLKLKIELLQGSRDSMQETTMQILKQTQLQSSKLAFVYSQNTMEMMKREWLKEYELKGEHSKKKCREKLNNLEKQISNLKSALENSVIEKNRYSERLASLNKEYNELHSVHLHCESRIEIIRNGVMPSLQDFDLLSEKLHSLEGISKAREENLRYSLEMKHSKVKKDFESYKVEISKRLNQKNNQIKEFQTEINSLVSMIGALKKEMLCPMNTNINKI